MWAGPNSDAIMQSLLDSCHLCIAQYPVLRNRVVLVRPPVVSYFIHNACTGSIWRVRATRTLTPALDRAE